MKQAFAFCAVIACFVGTVAALSAQNADWSAIGGYCTAVSVQLFLELTIEEGGAP